MIRVEAGLTRLARFEAGLPRLSRFIRIRALTTPAPFWQTTAVSGHQKLESCEILQNLENPAPDLHDYHNLKQDLHGHVCQDDQVFLIVPLITIYQD